MNAKVQRLCAMCGVFCTVAWLAGFWPLANYFAPHSPMLTGEELLAFYSTNTNTIILGLILLGFGAVLYQPWCAAISVQMRRIEGEHSPLSWVQLGLGSIFVWVFFLPVMIWIAIAYRPESTSPELILRMNDMAWLCFINPVCIIFFQGLSIGVCVLNDKRENPVFPRWFGFFNIWLVILYLPGSFVPLFKSGPFAWNGIFPWWIPVFLFVTWMVTTTVLLHKAIRRQEQEYNMKRPGNMSAMVTQAVAL
jgi:hypothetical protein